MKEFKAPAFLNKANIYEVNIRQYTQEGTFNAFASHLPRLKAMGVDILWLMPIHPIGIPHRKGSLGSYYSISNHRAINPEFGTMSDFENLVSAAHEMGMKIIIDWVANHTAWDHVWTVQHPEYFVRDEFGFKSPYDWTDVIQLDHQNEEQQQAMIDAMKFWVEEKSVDGFRADLAHLTPLTFWLKARRVIESINPEAIWLAESEEAEYTAVFDITFTWKWMHESAKVISEGGGAERLRNFLHQKDLPGLRLYFTTNHDENSWNGTEFEKYGVYARALAVFSCLYKNSVPLIYSGQEAANKKRLSFFDKDVLNWAGSDEMAKFYSALLSLRRKPGITFGQAGFKFIHHPKLLAFTHTGEAGSIWVFLHFGKVPETVQAFEVGGVDGTEIFSLNRMDRNSPAITLEPGDFLVYESFRSA